VRSGLVAAALVLATLVAAPASAHERIDLRFRGEAIVATGTTFAGTNVGGLSSITYDARRDVYYAISDDQVGARFYTLAIDERRVGVRFVDVTTLQAPGGGPYPNMSLDPEGLALTKDRELIVTSEGLPNSGIDPFVRRYSLRGAFLGDLPVPSAFDVTADQSSGVRPNLGFESAGVLGRHAFVGAENAVYQDGPAATTANGSPARILRYDLRKRRVDRQWIYVTDPVAEPPVPATAFSVNGLVELLPLDDDRLIAMERSFSVGAPGTGNTIKLYEVTLRRHTAHKRLLLDLDDLGIPLDNVEGMTRGPHDSLVLVSDNNFAAAQFTQFLLFALDARARGARSAGR
jgi:hypothetical protein